MYPVGIPLLYFTILWKNRHLLNPSVRANPETDEHGQPASADSIAPATITQTVLSPELARELEERVKMRKLNPDLMPSMFLWRDFGEELALVRDVYLVSFVMVHEFILNELDVISICRDRRFEEGGKVWGLRVVGVKVARFWWM